MYCIHFLSQMQKKKKKKKENQFFSVSMCVQGQQIPTKWKNKS